MRFNLFERVFAANRTTVLSACVWTIVFIALVDRLMVRDLSLALLYLLPIIVAAVHLAQWQVICLAASVAFLKEHYGAGGWKGDWDVRIPITWIAFSAVGFVVVEAVQRRRSEMASLDRLGAAEVEARIILESSPAAVLTANPDGQIDLTNDAARRLLGISADAGKGGKIGDYFPMLDELLRSGRNRTLVRTMVECRGRRSDGDFFFAQMWLSNFPASDGVKLVVVVADVSEQMRDREELGLRQLLMSSSIIAGAVSHEIRNLAAAAAMQYASIGKRFQLEGNEDFDALGGLIVALRKLSAPEPPSNLEEASMGVDLSGLVGELKIIAGSEEFAAQLEWSVTEKLPRVRAEHSGLLQVLLNLLRNSQRALAEQDNARIRISAYELGESVVISFSDNGPGVRRPETLFQPFQPGAHSTGLGLYVSRAIVRTFGGELQYDRRAEGSRFVIQLPVLDGAEESDSDSRRTG